MAFDAHKNFSYSTVLTAPSPASSGTSLVVQSGDGAKFPAVPFNATIWPVSSQPTSANAEIVRVTARSTDTLTITRATESSSARTVVVGDQIAATITAKTLTDIEVTLASDKKTRTSGDVSYSATSFGVLDIGLNITITTGARRCLVSWTLVGKSSTNAQQAVDVEIDGTRQGQTFGLDFQGGGSTGENANLSGTYVTDVLTAASHTFKLMFRVDAGTSTVYASTTIAPIVFSVVELPNS